MRALRPARAAGPRAAEGDAATGREQSACKYARDEYLFCMYI